MTYLIIALLIAVIAVSFAVQNISVVTISFLAWKFDTRLAVALLVALAAGVVITLLLSIPGRFKSERKTATFKKTLVQVEGERDQLKLKNEEFTKESVSLNAKLDQSNKEIQNLEQQVADLSGQVQTLQAGQIHEAPAAGDAVDSGISPSASGTGDSVV